ncbi:MAG: hypothetical protein MJ025_06805 [Victivallaceae bacterium]|nr:hypothetical protein [Victivallaceae bacterium]
MKRLAAAATLLLLCSCRSTISVDGHNYDMLRDSEKEELVRMARNYLYRCRSDKNIVTMDELRILDVTEPKMTIEYKDNLSGNARITWKFPNRTTTILVRGQLTVPGKRYAVISVQDETRRIIDTTGSISEEQKKRLLDGEGAGKNKEERVTAPARL